MKKGLLLFLLPLLSCENKECDSIQSIENLNLDIELAGNCVILHENRKLRQFGHNKASFEDYNSKGKRKVTFIIDYSDSKSEIFKQGIEYNWKLNYKYFTEKPIFRVKEHVKIDSVFTRTEGYSDSIFVDFLYYQ